MEKNGNRDMTLDAQLDREVGRLFDGAPADDGRIRFAVPDAHNVLMRGLRYFLGDKAVWLPEYDKVAEWLAGNDGKGLLLYGNCGRGKTLITQKILPEVFRWYVRKILPVFTARDLNERFAEVMQYRMVAIDDLGTEGDAMIYGNRRVFFSELVDDAERHGKTLIISTNLRRKKSVGEPSIEERYGIRTLDRLRLLTRSVAFVGESMRR